MAKTAKKARGKFVDEKYLGPEPDLEEGCNTLDLAKAYNWYNYFYTSEDAKGFVLTYLKQIKHNKEVIKRLSQAENWRFNTVGWNCRILFNKGYLPDDVQERMWQKIDEIANAVIVTDVEEDEVIEPTKPVISIQERIANKAAELIGDIEEELDKFYLNNKEVFLAKKWFQGKGIKPQIAAKIAEYYKPLYSEVFDAIEGKDEQLKEAYAHWKKPALKAYLEILREIIGQADVQAAVAKATRKPRKKKEKPAAEIVKNLKFKVSDDEYKINSIKPTEILGCNQLWVFNSKTRTLSVYNAMGPAGLSIKGTTLTGFDEKTSLTKKLRKPSEQLKLLIDAGKVNLRKFMDNIKCVPKVANGRINMDTVLVRAIK